MPPAARRISEGVDVWWLRTAKYVDKKRQSMSSLEVSMILLVSPTFLIGACKNTGLPTAIAHPTRGTFLSPLSPGLHVSVNMALVDSGSSDCELRQGFLEAGQPLEQDDPGIQTQ